MMKFKDIIGWHDEPIHFILAVMFVFLMDAQLTLLGVARFGIFAEANILMRKMWLDNMWGALAGMVGMLPVVSWVIYEHWDEIPGWNKALVWFVVVYLRTFTAIIPWLLVHAGIVYLAV